MTSIEDSSFFSLEDISMDVKNNVQCLQMKEFDLQMIEKSSHKKFGLGPCHNPQPQIK